MQTIILLIFFSANSGDIKEVECDKIANLQEEIFEVLHPGNLEGMALIFFAKDENCSYTQKVFRVKRKVNYFKFELKLYNSTHRTTKYNLIIFRNYKQIDFHLIDKSKHYRNFNVTIEPKKFKILNIIVPINSKIGLNDFLLVLLDVTTTLDNPFRFLHYRFQVLSDSSLIFQENLFLKSYYDLEKFLYKQSNGKVSRSVLLRSKFLKNELSLILGTYYEGLKLLIIPLFKDRVCSSKFFFHLSKSNSIMEFKVPIQKFHCASGKRPDAFLVIENPFIILEDSNGQITKKPHYVHLYDAFIDNK